MHNTQVCAASEHLSRSNMNESTRSSTTLTRQQLYDRVWAVSAVQLAKELGVSDVAIAKACKRYQIPKPPLGYWAKIAAGKAPPRPKLPVVIDPKLQSVTFSPPRPREDLKAFAGTASTSSPQEYVCRTSEVVDLLSRIAQSELAWAVPESLTKPHRVVASTRDGLRRCSKERRYVRPGEADFLYPRSHGSNDALLDIRVSQDLVDRVARLAQGILDAALAVGFEMRQRGDGYSKRVFLEMFHHEIQFGIEELTTQHRHVPTAEELAALAENPRRRPPKWDRRPSGRLKVGLYAQEWRHEFAVFADRDDRKLEVMIREIVIAMLAEVDRHLVRRREEGERHRKMFAEADDRRREEERRKLEQQRIDELVAQVDRWELARRIRRFVRTIELTRAQNGLVDDPEGKVAAWYAWAKGVADKLDPLRQHW